jgi:hypothetical protein
MVFILPAVMASLRAGALLSLTLALCAYGAIAEGVNQVVNDLNELTALSNQQRLTVDKLTLLNAPIAGASVPEGNVGIVARLTQATLALNSTPNNPVVPQTVFSNADAGLIINAVVTYVQAQRNMLNVEIEKHGLLTLAAFFAPTLVLLRALEQGTDAYVFTLVSQAPTQMSSLQSQFGSLQSTIAQAIAAYEQLTP